MGFCTKEKDAVSHNGLPHPYFMDFAMTRRLHRYRQKSIGTRRLLPDKMEQHAGKIFMEPLNQEAALHQQAAAVNLAVWLGQPADPDKLLSLCPFLKFLGILDFQPVIPVRIKAF